MYPKQRCATKKPDGRDRLACPVYSGAYLAVYEMIYIFET
jgi:hypothetical protein